MVAKRSALGSNPLAQGIFTKTVEETPTTVPPQLIKKEEAVIRNEETSFLNSGVKEKLNLRISLGVNDWLDELLKNGKRRHGQKIPKEVWIQAALELFQSMPVEWKDIEDEDALRTELSVLVSRIKKLDHRA